MSNTARVNVRLAFPSERWLASKPDTSLYPLQLATSAGLRLCRVIMVEGTDTAGVFHRHRLTPSPWTWFMLECDQ